MSSDPDVWRRHAIKVRRLEEWLRRVLEASNGGGAAAEAADGLESLRFAAAELEHRGDDLEFAALAGEPTHAITMAVEHRPQNADDAAALTRVAYEAGRRMAGRVRSVGRLPRGAVYIGTHLDPVLVVADDGAHDQAFCECPACEASRAGELAPADLGPEDLRRAMAAVSARRAGVTDE